MMRTVVVRGRVVGSRTVEVDDLLPASPADQVEVEVVIRFPAPSRVDDFADFLARLPAGTRSKADIDAQIEEERASWSR